MLPVRGGEEGDWGVLGLGCGRVWVERAIMVELVKQVHLQKEGGAEDC